MNRLIQVKETTPLFLLVLACLALSPQAPAVCQQGCDPTNDNTFLGDDALLNNTAGIRNTAIGFQALFNNPSGSANTAIGFTALFSNTTGSGNTATGFLALFSNNADGNTATGYAALYSNTTGRGNTANGRAALFSNTERKIREQQTTIAELKKGLQSVVAQLKEQDSKIQRVSARIELQTAFPPTVVNNQ